MSAKLLSVKLVFFTFVINKCFSGRNLRLHISPAPHQIFYALFISISTTGSYFIQWVITCYYNYLRNLQIVPQVVSGSPFSWLLSPHFFFCDSFVEI